MATTATEIGEQWPDAQIRGRYGNVSVFLEVVVENSVIATISLYDGKIFECQPPYSATRGVFYYS